MHSSGDPSLANWLSFSPGACEAGITALKGGAVILTDTAMAAAAVKPMAGRTLGNEVRCLLDWAPELSPQGSTRSAAAMSRAWPDLVKAAQADGKPLPLVLIGSAPTALEQLIDQCDAGLQAPSLLVGMPVGFVGVPESKSRLKKSALIQVRLDGTRGGAGLAAAVSNELMRQALLLEDRNS